MISDYFGINIDDFRNSEFSEFTEQQLNNLLHSKDKPKLSKESSEDFSNEKRQLEFHNKLLSQQIEGLQIQLKLVKQIVESKDSEIKSLQIQVRLLEEKLLG